MFSKPRTKPIGRGVPLKRGEFRPATYHSRTTAKGLRDELDILTSRIIRKLFGEVCVTCGSTEDITNGHLFSRRYMATRFDIHRGGNNAPQCWPCNQLHQENRNPYTFWHVREFGSESVAALRERAYSGRTYSIVELEEMVDEYRKILRKLSKAA